MKSLAIDIYLLNNSVKYDVSALSCFPLYPLGYTGPNKLLSFRCLWNQRLEPSTNKSGWHCTVVKITFSKSFVMQSVVSIVQNTKWKTAASKFNKFLFGQNTVGHVNFGDRDTTEASKMGQLLSVDCTQFGGLVEQKMYFKRYILLRGILCWGTKVDLEMRWLLTLPRRADHW